MPTPQRILIVDDEPDLLRALALRLGAAGLACDTARNGREALEQIARSAPDLIVTDLVMPELDGFQLIQRLKAGAQTAAIPVIALTAMPKPALDSRLNKLEAVRVIRKPFEFDQVLSIARELLATTIQGGSSHG